MGNFRQSLNATNTSIPVHGVDYDQKDVQQGALIVAINLFLSFIGTIGNSLIITAVLKTTQLRQKLSNNLLVSLGAADLIVTMVSQPLFAASESIKTFHQRCSVGVDKAYLTATAFSGCCSTLHLAAISIDRANSAIRPHQHRGFIKKWWKAMLYFCWGAAILYGSFIVEFPQVKISSQVSLVLSFTIMLCSYGAIICKVRAPVNSVGAEYSSARERALEKRVSGTVAIVISLFAACWFPVVVYSLYKPNYQMICSFDVKLSWIRSLLLSNSSMNFIVYSLRIRQFRAAYVRLIKKSSTICFGRCNRVENVVIQVSPASFSVNPKSSTSRTK